MKQILSWLKDEESGQGMVEYALIVGVIAVIVIVVMNVLGPKIKGVADGIKVPTVGTDGTVS